jgi:O-antigen/teichoic acid export membrane protein
MGLSQTLNREMARFRGGVHTAQSIRDLLRSMEVIYFLVAIIIVGTVFCGSSWIASNWLKVEKLNPLVVADALAIMGAVIAFRWLGGLYRSAISGLQEQVRLNMSNIVFATLRGFGVIGVLAWFSPSIQAFFFYQGLVSLLETVVLGSMLHVLLPSASVPSRFSWVAISQAWRFTGGVMLITLLVLLMTQVDKLLLSKWLSLTEFGYYSLAGVVASVLYMLVNPVGAAVSPRLAEMVAKGEVVAIKNAYHRYSQFLVMTVAPAALVIAAFSDHLLLLWTRDLQISAAVSPIVSALCIGTFLNALMSIPYYLQLAYGWTRLTIQISVVVVLVYIPCLFLVVPSFGSLGAAWLWAGINAFFIIVALPFMHRKLMPGELGRWYRQDVFPAFFVSSMIVLIGRSLVSKPDLASPFYSLGVLCLFALLTLLAATLATPVGREVVRTLKNNMFYAHRKQ